ncbi:MAG TPA: hypothetical protein VJA26_15060 [Gammaproteobacteria bacterium]|nr:hypothetical protein [Gammaproteobacteria bacterium]
MSAEVMVVRPRSGRREALLVGAIIVAIVLAGAVLVQARQVDNFEPRLFGWQISSFYDLNPTDQAIYNALVTAGEELWWIYGGRMEFPQPGEEDEPWPSVQSLDEDYELAPFVKDLAWSQQGKVQWQRIAAFSFEGSSVYYGAGGQVEGQGAYLLVLSHVHKGASYADGATMWIHRDPNAPPPTTIKTDSLIVNGWKEIIPYSGAVEVRRLKGG